METRFRVLGPLEISGDGPIPVTAPRQQVILALLLLDANRVVPLAKMISAIWDTAPPATSRAQVQTSVSSLRRSLLKGGLGERIRMQGLGYAIELAPGELDLHIFSELVGHGRSAVAQGQLETARTAFRQALGLWRGAPLSGIDSAVVQAALIQATERRVDVIEECVDVELELGQHHQVVAELKALTAEHPLREQMAGQLMTALYRCGRQAEALGAYRMLRKAFVEELGLEPSATLRRLEHAILTGSAEMDCAAGILIPIGAAALAAGGRAAQDIAGATDAAPAGLAVAAPAGLPVPRMLPAQPPDFAGRARLLRALGEELGQRGGGPQVAVITGRGGVGKSTVAIAAAHDLAASFPDGQLYAHMSIGTPQVLERFLRALGLAGSAIPDDFDERATLYRSAIAGRRLLILLEDADDETQVRPLLPGTPTCRLMLTSRERLAALPGAKVFEIDVVDTLAGVELMQAMLGKDRITASPSDVIDLVRACGGLPLAMRVAANRLIARPHWTVSQLAARLHDEGRLLDELPGVRQIFETTYDVLKPTAKRLFGRLGILAGEDFAAWVAGPLLDLHTGEAADVLETLVDARLVDVLGGTGTAARYRLHRLVRAYTRELLRLEESATDRLAAWRRVLGAWLHLADEANRRRRSGDYAGIVGDATRWEVPGADRLIADPLAWYDLERSTLLATIDHASRSDTVEACWNLTVTTASLADARDDYSAWRASHEAALRAASGHDHARGEAALLLSLGTLDLRQRRLDDAQARFGLALGVFERTGDAQWRSQALRSMTLLDRARNSVAC